MSGIGSFISLGQDGRTSSSLGAMVNLVCTVVGTGLLKLPLSAAQSGWIGVPVLLILGIMAGYTSDLVVKTMNLLNQSDGFKGSTEMALDPGSQVTLDTGRRERPTGSSRAETYGDLGEASFGCVGRWLVNVQLYMTLVGVAAIYHILGGLNMTILFSGLSQFRAVMIIAVVLWVHVFLRTLGEVSWVSYINAGVTITLEVVVIVVALMYPPNYDVNTAVVNTEHLLSFGSAFSGFVFAFGVHAVTPSIYRSMKTPTDFRKVNAAAFVFVLVLYIPMICVGYGVYGDQVDAPIYDTQGFKGRPVVTFIVWLITALILMSYMIVINVPELALETSLGIDEKPGACFWRLILRTCFLAFTAFISLAIGVEKFGPTLDLVSSITSTCTCYTFPSLFYLRITSKLGVSIPAWELMLNIVIIVVSLVGAVFGTIGALGEFGLL